MKSRPGCSTISALLTVAALSAVGVAGYASFTGKSLCSMVHGCPSESNSVAVAPASTTVPVAAEGEKPCCAMSKLAKAKQLAKLVGADARAMCGKTMTVHARNTNAVILGATYPIAIPAAFYDSNATIDESTLVSSGGCSGAAKSIKSECTRPAATLINASATGEKADGCCKGSGQRADGKSCCGGCKDKATTKAAEPIAEKPATDAANPS